MCENQLELYSISYFIEMNNANNKSNLMTNTLFPKPTFVVDPRRAQVVNMSNASQPPAFAFQSRSIACKLTKKKKTNSLKLSVFSKRRENRQFPIENASHYGQAF
jgi:hypothetical protein